MQEELAVANEALKSEESRVQASRDRLTQQEDHANRLSLVFESLRNEKGRLEEMNARNGEALTCLSKHREDLNLRLEASDSAVARLRNQLETAAEERTRTERALSEATTKLASAVERTDTLDARELAGKLATTEEKLAQERVQAADKLALLSDARERMSHEFKTIAIDTGETFSKQNKQELDTVLTPLLERISEFQRSLQEAHHESGKERANLVHQIREVSQSNASLQQEATNLARTLKGDAQKQGTWGEMILSAVLERSGLRNGHEYITQETHSDEDGQRRRPDAVINLPGGKES